MTIVGGHDIRRRRVRVNVDPSPLDDPHAHDPQEPLRGDARVAAIVPGSPPS